MLVFNIFPRLFPIKDVVELTEKAGNALRSKSKNVAVRQKETKLNEKGRSASAIMSRRRCIDHPQKWKVLYLSIDRSRTVASQYDRDRMYEPDVSTFELTRTQEASSGRPDCTPRCARLISCLVSASCRKEQSCPHVI